MKSSSSSQRHEGSKTRSRVELQASLYTNVGYMPPIVGHYLSASLQAKFLEDCMQMILDGAHRDIQLRSDVPVAPALGKDATYLALSGGQALPRVIAALVHCHLENPKRLMGSQTLLAGESLTGP